MMSYTYEITNKGKDLIAKAQTGTIIDFTRVELGKGTLDGSPAEFKKLLDPVPTNAIIQQKEFIPGNTEAKITITYTNESLLEGFDVKEIGLYANDPNTGEILFLYCYSDEADYLPVASYASVEQVVNLIIKVDNASEVTAQIIPETNVIRNNFSANSILKANSDNEPQALIIEEDRILGRKTGGVIKDLTPDDIREIQNLASNNAVFKKDIIVDGDVKFSNYTEGYLTSDESGNISSLTMPENSIAGRGEGNIGALTPNDVRNILNLATDNAVFNGELQLTNYGNGFLISDDSGNITSIPLTGFIMPWPMADVPTGFLSCNGASVSRTTYSNLFSAIGTNYGNVDEDHFNLPDYRGEFLRGWDNGAGNDPDSSTRTNRGDGVTGDFVGTKQGNDFFSHSHSAGIPHRPSGSVNSQGILGATQRAASSYSWTIGINTHETGGNETRPRNVSVQYIIKT